MANECDFATIHSFVSKIVVTFSIPFDELILRADKLFMDYPPEKLLKCASSSLKKQVANDEWVFLLIWVNYMNWFTWLHISPVHMLPIHRIIMSCYFLRIIFFRQNRIKDGQCVSDWAMLVMSEGLDTSLINLNQSTSQEASPSSQSGGGSTLNSPHKLFRANQINWAVYNVWGLSYIWPCIGIISGIIGYTIIHRYKLFI